MGPIAVRMDSDDIDPARTGPAGEPGVGQRIVLWPQVVAQASSCYWLTSVSGLCPHSRQRGAALSRWWVDRQAWGKTQADRKAQPVLFRGAARRDCARVDRASDKPPHRGPGGGESTA